MALPGLLPMLDFRKNYSFHWQLQGIENFVVSMSEEVVKSGKPNLKAVAFQAYCVLNMLYVSQLAREIRLPDDEVNIEKVKIGLVEFPVVTGVKMDDIEVTYLEDTANTVYDFHKKWQSCVLDKGDGLDKGNGFALKAIEPWTMEGWYIPTDKSKSEIMAMADDATAGIRNGVSKAMKSYGSHIYNPVTDTGITELSQARGLQIYPKIFPTKISRGTMNKSGKDLATVSVTYVRVPKMLNDNILSRPVTNFNGKIRREIIDDGTGKGTTYEVKPID